jgi:hypothetical protein
LIRLSKARPEMVEAYLFRLWRELAPKAVVKAFLALGGPQAG